MATVLAPAPARTRSLHDVPLPVCVLVLSALLAVVVVLAAGIGSVSIPAGDAWRIVAAHLTGQPVAGDPALDQILWNFRVPRVLLAALCGAGLAVAGVVLQALTGNPLADPYILGVSAGGSVGAVLVLSATAGTLGGLGVSGAAFLGAMLAVGLVFLLGQRRGRLDPVRLILAGVAVSYAFTSITSYLQLRAAPNDMRQIMFWLLGSVSGAHWSQLSVVGVVVVAATLLLTLFGRQLNALVTGDESATALGVDVRRLRIGLIVLTSLLAGAMIAVAGGIGFVGLMVPHLVRMAFGADHRRLLPLSALVGALYLVVVDLLSRTLDAPNELPLNVLTALFGAPFFVWLLRRDRSVMS
ncbi:MAG: iron chelate uptake ABC transporter family permease subunit [Actinophytocola sp.]|uniref:FecCD family ABC transporter permease n=1 Tax=Actinophytocola sp. TaxID=1872138 RepID=UPI00132A1E9D|nr:iron ABC transporter permease [Actinophytocola sp.]MPZ81196.1 iron chelate uptake ABC transporter family permease subunit [Actinophytocola sp.]